MALLQSPVPRWPVPGGRPQTEDHRHVCTKFYPMSIGQVRNDITAVSIEANRTVYPTGWGPRPTPRSTEPYPPKEAPRLAPNAQRQHRTVCSPSAAVCEPLQAPRSAMDAAAIQQQAGNVRSFIALPCSHHVGPWRSVWDDFPYWLIRSGCRPTGSHHVRATLAWRACARIDAAASSSTLCAL
jgi:hypothetical protein